MRIGIDIRELEFGTMTGIGRYLLNFLTYIANFDKENEYFLFGNQHTSCPIKSDNFNIKIIPEFLIVYWDQIVLTQQIKYHKIDLFFSPYYKGPILGAAKVIITIHDMIPWLMRPKTNIEAIGFMLYLRWMVKHADKIITVSEFIKKQLINYYKLKSENIEVVYNSAGECFKEAERNVALNKLNAKYNNIGENYILSVGNPRPHKNLERLIEAYSILPEYLKNKYMLVIVGQKNKFFENLNKIVNRNNLVKNIIFTGMLNDNELVYFYNAATLTVLVSLYEGFGLPALEAMQCGCPVVVSNITALPEIVGEAGVLTSPYNSKDISTKIKKVLEDERLREVLSKKGLEQTKKFSVKNSSEKLLSVFREFHNESI